MSALTIRTAFRGFAGAVVILIALTAPSFFTDTALAGKVALAGTHSASDIKAACGGDFVADGAAYGCEKTAGDGSKTSVTCNWDGQCQGSCKSCGGGAAIVRGKNPVVGVLSGNPLKASGTAKQTVNGAGSTHHPVAAKLVKPTGEMSQDHSNKKK